MRTACTSCRWNRMSFVAPQMAICGFTVPEMRAVPGRPSTGGCRKKGHTKRYYGMPCRQIPLIRRGFGTRSGTVYGSRDEGKSWKKIVDRLPQILCVKAAVVHMDGVPTTRPNLKSKIPKRRKLARTKRVRRGKSG